MSDSATKRAREGEDPIAAAKRIALERAKSITEKLASGGSMPAGYNAMPVGGRFERKVYVPLNNPNGYNYVGLIIGPKARTLRELQMKTGCVLQIRGKGMAKPVYDANGNEEEQHVYMSAASEELVIKAERMITEIFTDPAKAEELKRSQMPDLDLQSRSSAYGSGRMTKIVNVPNDLAGAIIGRGGEQIKQFIAQSGAHIQIDNSPENKMKTLRDLTVQGTPDQIERAEQLINDFVGAKRGEGMGIGGAASAGSALGFPFKMNLEVPDNKVGLIIGKQGKTIHTIQTTFRCKVDIPLAHDPGNPEVRTLTVGAYTSQELEGAKNDVFSIITYGQPASTQNATFGAQPQFQTEAVLPVASQLASYSSYDSHQQSNGAGYGANGYSAPAAQPQSTVASESVGLRIGVESVQLLTAEKISEVQAKTGCRIIIPEAVDEGSNPPTKTITITGQSAQNQTAIQELNTVLAATASSAGQAAEGERKYTKEQWKQWREYYLAQGQPDIGEEAPAELRADNYEG